MPYHQFHYKPSVTNSESDGLCLIQHEIGDLNSSLTEIQVVLPLSSTGSLEVSGKEKFQPSDLKDDGRQN